MTFHIPVLYRSNKQSVIKKKQKELLTIQIAIWHERCRIVDFNHSCFDDETFIASNTSQLFDKLYDDAFKMCGEIMNLEGFDFEN